MSNLKVKLEPTLGTLRQSLAVNWEENFKTLNNFFVGEVYLLWAAVTKYHRLDGLTQDRNVFPTVLETTSPK